jgi:hypothetical protein
MFDCREANPAERPSEGGVHMKKKMLIMAVAAMALLSVGCAITDYEGHVNHQTQAEAKLWGTEVSFITGDPAFDGTYSYTVKYDNRGGRDTNLKIYNYRNQVPGSFSRDGQIDRDGDDIQGRGGILGGKFQTYWTVTDPAPGCQFFANRIQSHGHAPPEPALALCSTVNEEVDKDLDLQASFASTGDLISQIWSGALNNGFTMELTGLTLGGVNVPLSQAVSINAKANGIRPMQISVDLTQPGGAGLIQAILNNTSDGVPVSFGLNFAGGMAVNLPSHQQIAFSHDSLWNLLN